MSNATLTLNGLYQYGLYDNKDLFKNLTFPEGIDKQLAVDNILHNCADFEVLYPSFDFMTEAIKMFSTKWNRTFVKWLAVMATEYEPLDNYDRKEAWSDSMHESTSESSFASESTSLSTSESSSTSTSDSTSESSSTNNTRSAFNATTMQPDTSAAMTAATAGSGNTNSNSVSGRLDASESKDRRTGVLDNENVHRGRVHGNIGVMTTQKIFMEEWELDKLNIYDEIMKLFAREFLIPFTY